MEVSGQLYALATLPQGKSPSTHWTGGWVGPTASLNLVAKRESLCPCQELNSGSPASSLITILTELPMRTKIISSCSSVK